MKIYKLTVSVVCLLFAVGGYFLFDFVSYVGFSAEWVLANFTHEGERVFDMLWGAVGALFGFSFAAYNVAVGHLGLIINKNFDAPVELEDHLITKK